MTVDEDYLCSHRPPEYPAFMQDPTWVALATSEQRQQVVDYYEAVTVWTAEHQHCRP